MTEAGDDTPAAPAEVVPGPTSALGRAVQALDDGVLRVERTFVTLAALLMTATVSLDILYRAFASGESVLARKLLTFLGLFGVERTQGGYEILRDFVVPALLGGLCVFAGWAIYSAGRRRAERPRLPAMGLAWGIATLGLCVALVQFVIRAPSTWVCGTLLVLGCLGYGIYAGRRSDWVGVGLSAIIAAAGAWAASKLPPQYIWSQELSLILLAWMAFLGGSMATRFERHIQVDALGRIIPKSVRPWARAVGLAATTIFCLYMAILSYEHVFGPQGDFNSGELRPATRIPAWTIIFSAVVAFTLMTLRFLGRTVDAFVHPKVPGQRLDH